MFGGSLLLITISFWEAPPDLPLRPGRGQVLEHWTPRHWDVCHALGVIRFIHKIVQDQSWWNWNIMVCIRLMKAWKGQENCVDKWLRLSWHLLMLHWHAFFYPLSWPHREFLANSWHIRKQKLRSCLQRVRQDKLAPAGNGLLLFCLSTQRRLSGEWKKSGNI